jgi:uroporphyrinogen decarboxylase
MNPQTESHPHATDSRERVLTSLAHRQPDRVPIDFGAHRSSGIAAIAYAKLRDHLGLPKRTVRVYDLPQQLAVIDGDVLDRFGVDTIELGRGFALEDQHWADWTLPDGTPCQVPVWCRPEREGNRWVLRSPKTGIVVAEMPDASLYFEQTHFPFLDGPPDHANLADHYSESMWTGVASPPGPLAAAPGALRAGAERLRSSTGRAMVGLFGGNLLEMGTFMYRNDEFFMLLAGEPDDARDFLEKTTQTHLRNLEKFLGELAGQIDVILFGDDLGGQGGPLISPDMYRELFKPHHTTLFNRAKELAPGIRVMLHCCGGVRQLLPDLIDAGLDAINPVQITCTGMEAAGLKRDFGMDLTFWGGGCDTRDILPHGTPETIRAHVLRQLEILAPGGGYVFQQVHNIMADVPPENIVAMFDAVREFQSATHL